jgi:site-specific DNA-methyltransferase (adenine-specific)
VNRILLGDNLQILPTLPAAFARLVYIDPPFNTGGIQKRRRQRGTASENGNRAPGFHGRRFKTEIIPSPDYSDDFEDYIAFLMPRIEASLRCLTKDGSLFVHLDYREVHYVKVALDQLLGRARFMNEIIWAYDYGARTRRRWPCKHDTILWYAMDPANYVFNFDAMDRLPYMAPKLVTPEKREKGKTPTDVWWQTIVPTNSREKTGYPTQKPLAILERVIKVHTDPGDIVLDYFAGSGTTGEAAARNGREFVLIDSARAAASTMNKRLSAFLANPVSRRGAEHAEEVLPPPSAPLREVVS